LVLLSVVIVSERTKPDTRSVWKYKLVFHLIKPRSERFVYIARALYQVVGLRQFLPEENHIAAFVGASFYAKLTEYRVRLTSTSATAKPD
jgi:hypothetical protein